MVFVVVTRRVVKRNTGATAEFAPRTANYEFETVSGPFLTLRAAQRAALTVLNTHTCLSAQVMTADQVRRGYEAGYSRNGDDRQKLFTDALQLIEAAGS